MTKIKPKPAKRMKGKPASKRMQRMMKNMQEVTAKRIIMELEDGSGLLLESPQVIQMNVQGQETWQIIGSSESLSPEEMKELMQGEAEEEEIEIEIREEDVMLVSAQTGVSPEEARSALKQTNGEPARAIMMLKSL